MAWRFKASKYKNSTPKNPKREVSTSYLCIQKNTHKHTSMNKHQKKPKGQSRMDNPEIQQHWAHKTLDEDKQKNTTQKTIKFSNTDLTQKPKVNPDAHKG